MSTVTIHVAKQVLAVDDAPETLNTDYIDWLYQAVKENHPKATILILISND